MYQYYHTILIPESLAFDQAFIGLQKVLAHFGALIGANARDTTGLTYGKKLRCDVAPNGSKNLQSAMFIGIGLQTCRNACRLLHFEYDLALDMTS